MGLTGVRTSYAYPATRKKSMDGGTPVLYASEPAQDRLIVPHGHDISELSGVASQASLNALSADVTGLATDVNGISSTIVAINTTLQGFVSTLTNVDTSLDTLASVVNNLVTRVEALEQG